MTAATNLIERPVSLLNPVERTVLTVMRHYLNAFITPETQGWRHAMAAATGVWGEARGLAIANAIQEFLSTVLQHRPVPLRYSDPLDLIARGYVTQDEDAVLSLIANMRHDRVALARDMIGHLTDGRIHAQVVRTGLNLANRLDPCADKGPPQKRPHLRIVR